MPSDKPTKSVNLDPEDHQLAQELAKRLTATAPAVDDHLNARVHVTIRGAIHYALASVDALQSKVEAANELAAAVQAFNEWTASPSDGDQLSQLENLRRALKEYRGQ